MRVLGLDIVGFRGFSRRERFNLDADAIIVVAPNGQGKTSLFDALLWGLTGRVPRLGSDDSNLLSMYSETGEIDVRVVLQDEKERKRLTVIRSSNGNSQRITVEADGKELIGNAATTLLTQTLWPPAITSDDPRHALASVLTRTNYLQQDLVRDFVQAQTEQDRFSVVSDLLGTGRVNELYVQLDNARSAWTRASNVKESEANSIRSRVATLEARIATLETPAEPSGIPRFQEWLQQVRNLGITIVESDPTRAPSIIDATIKEIQATRAHLDRRKSVITNLVLDIGRLDSFVLPNVEGINSRVEQLKKELAVQKDLLQEVQHSAAEARREYILQRDRAQELSTLAQLALRHLGDKCPVCDQNYDQVRTRERLESLASQGGPSGPVAYEQELGQLAHGVEVYERELAGANEQLRQAENMMRSHSEQSDRIKQQLTEVGIAAITGAAEALQTEQVRITALLSGLAAAQETGEKLALQTARTSELSRRRELERELATVRQELREAEEALRVRRQTYDLASRLVEELQAATTDIVERELSRIEPLLQRIYARIDPHPSFRIVKFLTRFAYRRGRLLMSIIDPTEAKTSEAPELVLSSSQLNALAVAIFLSLNLGIGNLPIDSVILDDPLQSLDDINLLGLVDLLRRTKDARQLVVSTHDPRFGALLERKLRPIGSNQRTIVIEFEGWSRKGPICYERSLSPDDHPMKIAV